MTDINIAAIRERNARRGGEFRNPRVGDTIRLSALNNPGDPGEDLPDVVTGVVEVVVEGSRFGTSVEISGTRRYLSDYDHVESAEPSGKEDVETLLALLESVENRKVQLAATIAHALDITRAALPTSRVAAKKVLEAADTNAEVTLRDAAVRRAAFAEAAKIAEQWGHDNEEGGYARAAFSVADAIQAAAH